jgi:sugar diacid utilization regulator
MGSMSGESSSHFLELLAREAPAAEFEQPLAAARAAGAPAAVLAERERDRMLALRVRGLLAHRRRRETELAGLFDTASDLAGLRDLDAVLRAIVHRARTLLGADTAYLTLHDPERGDTYMRVTDGSVSARFQSLRLPMGAGLGGLVAQTATGYVTADYLADDRFRHTNEIDTGVREEGLVAILGVPLRLGEQVLGVLFAANRSRRPFDREEVALLGSLGLHAAVAIDSARLLAETRTALADLSAANETIRSWAEAVERAAAAHDRMAELVLLGGGVEQVAAAVVEVLGGGLLVLDADARPLASVGDTDSSPDAATGLAASRSAGRSVRRGDCWFAAVAAGGEDLGVLVWRPEREVGDGDQRILERAAMVTALLLLFRRTAAEAESRVRGELLDDLISGSAPEPDGLHARAARLGVDLRNSHVVVVADLGTGEPARQRALFWAGTHASAHHGLAAAHGGRVVLMVPGADPGAAARTAAADLSRVLGVAVTAGGAGPAVGPVAIADAFTAARRCVGALLALGRAGQGSSAAELGFVGLLLDTTEDGLATGGVARFVADTLGPVLDYDARRGTALVPTLAAYFTAGASPARAAERLHVHVNTVAQRLDRVSQLLGEDWQAPDRALEIQLALRLHRLAAPPTFRRVSSR